MKSNFKKLIGCLDGIKVIDRRLLSKLRLPAKTAVTIRRSGNNCAIAKFKNGVLEIKLPKKEESVGKKIPIES